MEATEHFIGCSRREPRAVYGSRTRRYSSQGAQRAREDRPAGAAVSPPMRPSTTHACTPGVPRSASSSSCTSCCSGGLSGRRCPAARCASLCGALARFDAFSSICAVLRAWRAPISALSLRTITGRLAASCLSAQRTNPGLVTRAASRPAPPVQARAPWLRRQMYLVALCGHAPQARAAQWHSGAGHRPQLCAGLRQLKGRHSRRRRRAAACRDPHKSSSPCRQSGHPPTLTSWRAAGGARRRRRGGAEQRSRPADLPHLSERRTSGAARLCGTPQASSAGQRRARSISPATPTNVSTGP